MDKISYGWAIEHEGEFIGTIGAYDFDLEKSKAEAGMSLVKTEESGLEVEGKTYDKLDFEYTAK